MKDEAWRPWRLLDPGKVSGILTEPGRGSGGLAKGPEILNRCPPPPQGPGPEIRSQRTAWTCFCQAATCRNKSLGFRVFTLRRKENVPVPGRPWCYRPRVLRQVQLGRSAQGFEGA